jgi:hypothetical protein
MNRDILGGKRGRTSALLNSKDERKERSQR